MKCTRLGRGHAAKQLEEFLKTGTPCSEVQYISGRRAKVVALCLEREIRLRKSEVTTVIRGNRVILINMNTLPILEVPNDK